MLSNSKMSIRSAIHVMAVLMVASILPITVSGQDSDQYLIRPVEMSAKAFETAIKKSTSKTNDPAVAVQKSVDVNRVEVDQVHSTDGLPKIEDAPASVQPSVASNETPVVQQSSKPVVATSVSAVSAVSVEPLDQIDAALYDELMGLAAGVEADSKQAIQLPPNVDAGWWQSLVGMPLRPGTDELPVSLDSLLFQTLNNSQQIQVFQQLPAIRQTAIIEADSAFDWNRYWDARWDDLSDPIGSTLTAGPGIGRFRDHQANLDGGIRRKTLSGAQVELSSQLGWQDNNSQFFVPDQQGTSRIVLGFTQPLMRGSGKPYNQSLVCLAQIDHAVAIDEMTRQVQTHLLEVSRAYWSLYLERGAMYQKLRSYQRAKGIVDRLTLRQHIDVSEAQLAAAKAAFADRQSGLLRSHNAIKNAESKIRSLVNAPELGDFELSELIPTEMPTFELTQVDARAAIAEAIAQRPEISQSLRQIKSASVRLGMAKHEMLPMLNLVTETYLAGLATEGEVGQAWVNQFNQGEPGYSVGFQYELPIGNRAARARSKRRQHELMQVEHQYRLTLETVQLEVQVAVREIETSQRELLTKQQVVSAREEQLAALLQRWERLPNDGVTSSLVLENILSAQDQLAAAEFEYLQAQITYNLSLINLRRATGTLVQQQAVVLN